MVKSFTAAAPKSSNDFVIFINKPVWV